MQQQDTLVGSSMDRMCHNSTDDIGSRTGLCMPGNRPVCCSNATGRVIVKTYDHMGRMAGRVESQDSIVLSHERYLYRGYLRIAALDMLNNAALIHAAVWDPTEPAATRPLLLQTPSGWFTYSFDQAKNVTELFDSAGGIAAAYDHGPFGEDMASTGSAAGLNPFRFSSEVWDGALGLVYYNWRHYNPLDGRFISRDPIGEQGGLNLYGFVGNDPVNRWDLLGRSSGKACCDGVEYDPSSHCCIDGRRYSKEKKATGIKRCCGYHDPLFTIMGYGFDIPDHCWVEYPGGAIGFGPGGVRNDTKYAAGYYEEYMGPTQPYKRCVELNASECDYNIDTISSCIKNAGNILPYAFPVHDCRHWSVVTYARCVLKGLR